MRRMTYTKPVCRTVRLQSGFKVVCREKGRMESATGRPWRRIKYRRGRLTVPRPGCGPLAVFKHEKLASIFLAGLTQYHPRYISRHELVALPCLYAPSQSKALWFGWRKGESKRDCFPPGTQFADAVFLLKAKP